MQLADVTGDGRLEILAGARYEDVGGVVDAGAVHIWATAPVGTQTPLVDATVPDAVEGDQLGS